MQGTQAESLAQAIAEAQQEISASASFAAAAAAPTHAPVEAPIEIMNPTPVVASPVPAQQAAVEMVPEPMVVTPPPSMVAEEAPPVAVIVPPALPPVALRTDSIAAGFYPASGSGLASSEMQANLFDEESLSEELVVKTPEAAKHAAVSSMPSAPMPKEKVKMSDLERAKQIARNLGVTNLSDDEYDIPTFIRRQQQNGPAAN
jgi:hypothetical protein